MEGDSSVSTTSKSEYASSKWLFPKSENVDNKTKESNPIIFARTKTIHVPEKFVKTNIKERLENVVYSAEQDGSLKQTPLPTIEEEVEAEPKVNPPSAFVFWMKALCNMFCLCDNDSNNPDNDMSSPLISSTEPVEEQRVVLDGPLLGEQLPQHKGKKTLVLDLDETLVHSTFQETPDADYIIPVTIEGSIYNVYVYVRPGVREFIQHLSELYEVIIYTASLDIYANPLLDLLDEKRVLAARLFRNSCILSDGVYVKDLGLLGREMQNVIMVDNAATSFKYQPSNGIECTCFIDDKNDKELYHMIPFLEFIADQDDVRLHSNKWRKPVLDVL